MPFLIDTSVAVHLRDGNERVIAQFASLEEKPFLSVITRVELEGGIHARPELAETRRAGVEALLAFLPAIDFDFEMAEAYGQILESAGFSKRKIVDRMIAATAMVNGLTLITVNGRDFRDIPGLDVVEWVAE